MSNSRIFTVSEINDAIRGILEVQFPFISIAGEISNLRQPLSGHSYFTLKDDKSQIRAVLFKMQKRYLSTKPADGQMVICRGRISVYEARGEYQLIVDTIDFHGTGVMQLEFEKLKQKLASEGLFDQEAKKQLPFLPEHVTLVTSPQGAAVHDFIRIAQARCPFTKLAVYPVSVQGEAAAGEISEAITTINEHLQTDIIILCRGGGSLEDLWAFNEEKLARAIAASTIPIVSAVGHEIDYTIADFAADLRAPTPSGAAEMILPEIKTLQLQVQQLKNRQFRSMKSTIKGFHNDIALHMHKLGTVRYPLDNLSMQLDHLAVKLHRSFASMFQTKKYELEKRTHQLRQVSPVYRLRFQKQKLNELQRRMFIATTAGIDNAKKSLAHAAGMLDAVSPLSTLARGYALAKTPPPESKIITSADQVEQGNVIEVTLKKGSLECRIEKTVTERSEVKKLPEKKG